jgi:hypothetical protein
MPNVIKHTVISEIFGHNYAVGGKSGGLQSVEIRVTISYTCMGEQEGIGLTPNIRYRGVNRCYDR